MAVYSIIKKSQLEGALRLDAEYYQPEFLELISKIKSQKLKLLKDFAEKIFSGPFGSTLKSESYKSEGIPFVRIGDISDIFINKKNLVYIPIEEHKRIFSTHLNPGDIVLSKIATIGRLSVISDDLGEVNISENNIGIRFTKLSREEKVYLLFFLLSKYGQSQILQKASGNIQLKLNVVDIENIEIPLITKKDQVYFLDLYEQIIKFRKQSEALYFGAENLLLEKLGLKDFKNKESLFSIVNLSDLKKTGRMDAEYFQSKFNILLSKVKTEKLGDLVLMKKGFEPGSDAYQENGKLFIRVSSLSKQGIEDKDQKYLSDELYQKLKNDFEPKVGEILLTKDATPGIAYAVKEPIEGIICGGILKLKTKENIEPEFLALCINSIIGKSQVERDAGGSIILHWKPEQIKNLQIPILPKEIQRKIADLVKKSHEARKKAKELLEEAKIKVEKLIKK